MPVALIYPGCKWTPLGAQTQRPMTAHDIACLHTMAGYLISTDRYFRISNGEGFRGTESHWGMGGIWGPDLGGGLDGEVYQWQDMRYSADANLDGWDRVLSMETADNAARPIRPWTKNQCEGLARWLAWVCSPAAHAKCPSSWKCHQVGIPLALIPDTKQGRRGVGYHRQGCDPYRVSGGEAWSKAYGKDCPTQARINQIPGIIARAKQLQAEGLPDTGDDSMSAEDVAQVNARIDGAVESLAALIRGTSAENPTLGNGPKATWNYYELPNPVTGDMEPIKNHVGYASKYGVLAYERAVEGLRATAGVAAQVAAVQEMLATQKGLTAADLDRIRQAAQDGADAAIEQRIEDARVELVVAREAAES